MIAVTSISPTHVNKDIQSIAVKSWADLGMKVYSFNSKREVETLAPLYPDVTFIETTRTMENTFRKPYVSLSAIFDWCKDQPGELFCLINSDIELRTDKETIARIEKLTTNNTGVFCNRHNYSASGVSGRYTQGVDVFFLNKAMISSMPQTLFCLGQCHFDYFIPYHLATKGFDVLFTEQDIAYHKDHSAQYNPADWVKTGQHLLWLTELYQFTNQIGRLSTHLHGYIYSAGKRALI